jgi:hypothetical protein
MKALANQRWTLMHNIDKSFHPNDDEEQPYCKEPISISKLAKNDDKIVHKGMSWLGWFGDFQELLEFRGDLRVNHSPKRKRGVTRVWAGIDASKKEFVPARNFSGLLKVLMFHTGGGLHDGSR